MELRVPDSVLVPASGSRKFENKGSKEGKAHCTLAHTQGLDAVAALPAASTQPWAHPHKPMLLPYFTDKETEAQRNEFTFARLLGVTEVGHPCWFV